MRAIAADVGGTKTLLELFEITDSQSRLLREDRLESASFETFTDLVRAFLRDGEAPVDAACFAIAGPAEDRHALMTNLGWSIDAETLERELGIGRVMLINDFHAVAAAIAVVDDRDLSVLNPRARDPRGTVAVLGAGTGLGEAILVRGEGTTLHVISSEGGHASFAPRTELQGRLLLFLAEKYGGHVSYERLLSGPGIVNIFTFLCEKVYHVSPEEIGVDSARGHVASQVAELAAQGLEVARKTVEIFVDIYGAEAGNLALKTLPRGGVFIAGGIAAKNLGWFRDGRFMEAYADKGRMRGLLLDIPVAVVSNPRLGLNGAKQVVIEATMQ
ncbi:MAG: glucokinase [Acidobacteria bacterium]|nr:glucokinase [Acidobacteriota bacterium]